jgi:hypothetical protein
VKTLSFLKEFLREQGYDDDSELSRRRFGRFLDGNRVRAFSSGTSPAHGRGLRGAHPSSAARGFLPRPLRERVSIASSRPVGSESCATISATPGDFRRTKKSTKRRSRPLRRLECGRATFFVTWHASPLWVLFAASDVGERRQDPRE